MLFDSFFNKVKPCLWAAILLLSISISGVAQQGASLRGTVTDPDNAAVAGAAVNLYSRDSAAKLSTRTGSTGAYRFDNVVAGDYLLEVEAEGFAGPSTVAVALRAGEAVRRDLKLQLAEVRTEVQVTASSTPLMIEEVAKSADVVTGEQMRLRDEYSIAEALRLTPGFRVKQLRGPGSMTTVRVRGLRSSDVALLVDGLRMRDPTDLQGSAVPMWENLMAVATDRVEVLRGSGSSLYGSHAIGGVTNLVSSQGGGGFHGELLAEGGGLGMFRGLAKASGGAMDNRLLYTAGASHLNVTRGLDEVNPYRNTTGQGYVKYQFTPAIAWSGRAFAADSFLRLADGPFVAPPVEANHPASGVVLGIPLPDDQVKLVEQGKPYTPGNATYIPSVNDPDDRSASSFQNVATIFSQQVTQSFSYRASYQYTGTNRQFDYGPGGVRWEPLFPKRNAYDGGIHLAQGRVDLATGSHNLISGGYEFEQERYNNVNTDQNPDVSARGYDSTTIEQRSHSVFVQDQIRLFDRRLQIALSGRVQVFRLDDPVFQGGSSPYEGVSINSPKRALTGDAAISYMFRSTGTKWRAHVGNAYRAPSAYERYGAGFYMGFFSPYGDPRLRPERALSVDTGFDQWLANSKIKLSATYFYTALQDTIIFDFSGLIPPTDPWHRFGGYLNLRGGLARGVETSLEARPTRGTVIQAAYTYTDSRERKRWGMGAVANQMPGISKNMFTLMASQWFGRRFNVTFDLFAAGSYLSRLYTSKGTRPFEMDGPVKADLVARYLVPLGETKNLEIFGKIENLLNDNLYEDGYRSPKLWGIGGLRFSF